VKVIAEADLGIGCDVKTCTAHAHYIVDVKGSWCGLYCARHTAILLQWTARVLDDGRDLHEVIEAEHLLTGEAINA
jgi:hypothetical protein